MRRTKLPTIVCTFQKYFFLLMFPFSVIIIVGVLWLWKIFIVSFSLFLQTRNSEINIFIQSCVVCTTNFEKLLQNQTSKCFKFLSAWTTHQNLGQFMIFPTPLFLLRFDPIHSNIMILLLLAKISWCSEIHLSPTEGAGRIFAKKNQYDQEAYH